MYLDLLSASADVNIKALENKFNKKLEVFKNQVKETKATFENKFTEKFALFESQINNLRKDLDIKNKHIISLETKIEYMV